MPAPGQAVSIGIAKQSAKGTVADGSTSGQEYYLMKHDLARESPGRISTRGRPLIGGAYNLATGLTMLGGRPRIAGVGPLRLGTIGKYLAAAGRKRGSVTGDGSSTPHVSPFSPEAAGPTEYHSWVIAYLSGAKYSVRDVRLQSLALRFRPGVEPTFEYVGFGTHHAASSVSIAAELADVTPSWGATVSSGDRTLFGSTGATLYALDVLIVNDLDNSGQPLGTFGPDDIRGIGSQIAVAFVVDMAADDYERLAYGSTSATSTGATVASGSLSLKINTGADLSGSSPYNVPGYIIVALSAANYELGGDNEVVTVARDTVRVPGVAVLASGGTETITLMNGTAGTAY